MLRHRVADAILADYIASGTLMPGHALPTVRELQKKYRVCSGTVLSAIAILEAQGLVTSKHGSGCYINGVSQSTKNEEHGSNSSRWIGFIRGNNEAWLHTCTQRGVDSYIRRYDYHLTVAMPEGGYEGEQDGVERMIDAGCDGLVIIPATRTPEQAANDYINKVHLDFPMVLVDMGIPSQNRSQVIFDNYNLGRNMTRHLLARGHKRIAFMQFRTVRAGLPNQSIANRYKGYRHVMADAGKPVVESDIWGVNSDSDQASVQSLADLLYAWREQTNRPTALIAVEDTIAAMTISIARELDISIPDELEIVGFDDIPAGRMIRPSFTTSRPDFTRAGEIASEILVQMISGDLEYPVRYMLPVPVLERDTPAIDNVLTTLGISRDCSEEN
ncbi:MAG: GntR family transcriptional regulator [Armatimonadota bacterium]|nr:GntR family transcriptional regulator [bacterium]